MTAPLGWRDGLSYPIPSKQQHPEPPSPSFRQSTSSSSSLTPSFLNIRHYRKRRRQPSMSSDVESPANEEPELTSTSSSSPDSPSSSSYLTLPDHLKTDGNLRSIVAGGKKRAIEKDREIRQDNGNRQSLAARTTRCKFAKAGCPFSGSSSEVESHETTYCTPLYTQLAHYKTIARQRSLSHPDPLHQYNYQVRQQEIIDVQTARITHLQSDLDRAQTQLEEEKRLRTERLRKANEKVLELMSLSELGEGKVEVYKLKLHAERELREKLEEELESLRASIVSCERQQVS